jgi:predicted ester cyclase
MNLKGKRTGAVITAFVAVAALSLTACGSSDDNTPVAAPTSTRSLSAADLVDTADGLVVPGKVHVDPAADPAQAKKVVHAAQVLYTFWNTGKTSYLDQAIEPSFRDNTLPPGRPQGPNGPRVASAGFRAAVPDLTCELADLYVTGDTLTARLVFRGHFTGTYNGIKGRGQRIDFNAFDIQHVGSGTKITEDWHLEDNLTFLTQAGLATVAGAK